MHRAAVGIRGPKLRGIPKPTNPRIDVDSNEYRGGNGQRTKLEFGRFVRIAANSASELEYHLIVARDIQLISASDFVTLSTQTIEVRKIIHGLLRHLNAVSPKISTTVLERLSDICDLCF